MRPTSNWKYCNLLRRRRMPNTRRYGSVFIPSLTGKLWTSSYWKLEKDRCHQHLAIIKQKYLFTRLSVAWFRLKSGRNFQQNAIENMCCSYTNRKVESLTHFVSSFLLLLLLTYRIAPKTLQCINNENILPNRWRQKKKLTLTHQSKMTNLKICPTKNGVGQKKLNGRRYKQSTDMRRHGRARSLKKCEIYALFMYNLTNGLSEKKNGNEKR